MRPYVKPELFLETFELAQNVAACANKLNQGSVTACVVVDSSLGDLGLTGANLFVASNTDCGTSVEIYCEESSSSGMATHAS